MSAIEVILKEKVAGLGAEADVVKVKRGYANNFLIPTGRAYEATKGNLRHREALNQKRALREAEELQKAEKKAGRIKKARLKLELSTGQGGKAFGSITTIDLLAGMAAFDKKLAEIDRHDILLDKPIKTTGDFEVMVKLHQDITVPLKVNVSAVPVEGTGDEEDAE
ncbi:MAG: 50S ribosomal protein L9 [Verrucomicrobiales bacterium]